MAFLKHTYMYLNLLILCLNIFKHEFNRFKIQIWKYRNMICFERGREVALLLLLSPQSSSQMLLSLSLNATQKSHPPPFTPSQYHRHSNTPQIKKNEHYQIAIKSRQKFSSVFLSTRHRNNILQHLQSHSTTNPYSNFEIGIQIQNLPQLRFLVVTMQNWTF